MKIVFSVKLLLMMQVVYETRIALPDDFFGMTFSSEAIPVKNPAAFTPCPWWQFWNFNKLKHYPSFFQVQVSINGYCECGERLSPQYGYASGFGLGIYFQCEDCGKIFDFCEDSGQ